MLKKILAFSLALTLCLPLAGAGFERAPILSARDYYVNDGAGVLSSADKRKILAAAKELYEITGVQAVALTIEAGLSDQAGREDFAGLIFKGWEIGGPEENGVLIMITPQPSDCVVRAGAGIREIFSSELTDTIRDRTMRIMENGKTPRALLEGFELIVMRIYSEFGAEPGESAGALLESGNEMAADFTPLIMIAGFALLFGRAVQITRKSRKLLQRGPIRKRRSFSAPSRDEPVFGADAICGQSKRDFAEESETIIYPAAKETYLDDTEDA